MRALWLGLLAFVTFTTTTLAADISGDWHGVLQGPGLQIIVHLQAGEDGKLTGSIDSIDQGAKGLPLADISATDTALSFTLPKAASRYDARWDAASQSWTGHWSQGGATLVLNLNRTPFAAAAAPARPQVPQKPYPYVEKDVRFTDGAVKLAGTLTIPQGKGPFPAVVLIAGSGANTRDETVFNHPIFLVLADHLTRHGIAVLRFDKRGVGASGGQYATALTQNFAEDAAAAFAFLKTEPAIDARHIGLIGHSEGGLIAPMVAARDPSVAFIVLLAGPGVPGDALPRLQLHTLNAAAGIHGEMLKQSDAVAELMIAQAKSATDLPQAQSDALRTAAAQGMNPQLAQQYAAMLFTPWFRSFMQLDPAIALSQVHCPVLALNGAKDMQVAAAQNLPAIRAALKGNAKADIREMPDLNHLFQTVGTGAPAEYGKIEETFAPAALQTITDWIKKTVH